MKRFVHQFVQRALSSMFCHACLYTRFHCHGYGDAEDGASALSMPVWQ